MSSSRRRWEKIPVNDHGEDLKTVKVLAHTTRQHAHRRHRHTGTTHTHTHTHTIKQEGNNKHAYNTTQSTKHKAQTHTHTKLHKHERATHPNMLTFVEVEGVSSRSTTTKTKKKAKKNRFVEARSYLRVRRCVEFRGRARSEEHNNAKFGHLVEEDCRLFLVLYHRLLARWFEHRSCCRRVRQFVH